MALRSMKSLRGSTLSPIKMEKVSSASMASLKCTRFKGLGEMDAPDLADTTMNPETRRMARVTVEDAAAADELFSVLLGSAVEPRKEYIIKHAKEVTNVDWHA